MNNENLLVTLLENIKKNFIKIRKNDEKEIYKRQKSITKREEIIKNYNKNKLLFNKTNLSYKKKENKNNHIIIKNYSDFENMTLEKIKLWKQNLNNRNNINEFKKSQSQRNFLKNNKSKKQLIDIPTKKYNFYSNPISKKIMCINKNYDKFLEQYEKIKIQKKRLNLEKYQTELLEIGSINLSSNSIKDLYNTFRNIRKDNLIRIEQSNSFIKGVEDDESKIYKKISKNQDDYVKILDKFKIKFEKDKLPKIKMKRIFKE